ncbi:glycerophosphoryl diester phosphodiesterase family domain-containing protein [Ditylenchus destructor]|nr:glycerophosphoryl diester phosphodiesterase family domain-containing protein [Ditylenchus destructor]
MFTVHFTVQLHTPSLQKLHDNEIMFVTGNHEQLGHWDPDGALKLTKDEQGRWTGTITLTGVEVVKFRYFIGYYLESEANKPPCLIVSHWETHLTPRSVMPAVEASKARVCRANVNDIFGFHGGRQMVGEGWLRNEDQNQILLTVTGTALKFYKSRHIHQNYRLKIVPLDLRNKHDSAMLDNNDNDEDGDNNDDSEQLPNLPSYSPTEIAPLTSENPKFRDQDEFGELFHNSVDYYMYRTCCIAVEYLGFRIEVFSTTSNELVAVGYALPSALHDTYGKTSVPLLTKKGIPVGKFYFGYLFVRPLRLPHPKQNMRASYSKHWKKRTTLEVGHRGMGNSYTKCAVARENTLHSLNSAAKNGADLVEFDVHLTKDKVAIVYHDFHVMVSVAKQRNGSASVDFYQLAVKDLKLAQLQLLHLDHVHHQNSTPKCTDSDSGGESTPTPGLHKVTAGHDETEEHRPFPTLVEAFNNVSEEVGFNVEVKYPMVTVDGQNECENYFERNEFLDIILADILNNAGQRRIVFSSFDPDICTMIALKQNKYPVLFLCVGHDTKHLTFVDERTSTSMTAVKFIAGFGLLGVNFNSEDVLRDPAPILKAQEYGLITFVWGDELIEKKNVEYFKKTLLVDGVIYDRIGEGETRSNVFSLEKQMKAALFTKKPPSPVTPRTSSVVHLNSHVTNGHSRVSKPKLNGMSQVPDGYDSDSSYYEGSDATATAEKNSPKAIFSISMEWPQHKPTGKTNVREIANTMTRKQKASPNGDI